MIIRPDAGAWSGFTDSVGERTTTVDMDGRPVDLLRLFPAFTPASQALADRIALLDLARPAVSRAIALERDEGSSRLILISEHVPGVRLSELLQAAVQRAVVPDLGAALFVMRRLLTLAESLNAATGLAQFSIAPERIVITPHGRVVIVEPVLAAAADTGAIVSDDLAGIAIAGMSIMLGHLIEDAEHIDPLSPVLQDAADVAAIRAGHRFSTALRLWFDRAITADPALSFPGFRQARLALPRVSLARESGCDASRLALKVFLNDLAFEPLTEVEAGALEVDRLREIRATRLARRNAISAPDEEWISVEDELFIGDLVEEPIEADPAPPPGSWLRSMAQQLGLAAAEPQPVQTDIAAPPGDVPLESLQAEDSAEPMTGPLAADPEVAAGSSPVLTEPECEEASSESGDADEQGLGETSVESWRRWTEPVQQESPTPRTEAEEQLWEADTEDLNETAESGLRSEPIGARVDKDAPVAPVDESIGARQSDDAHRSWILSITEQLGRMRRQEQELLDPPAETTAATTDVAPPVDRTETGPPGESRETVAEAETLLSEAAEDAPAAQTAHLQFERAATPDEEERTQQPAWSTPALEPWEDDAIAAGTALPFPAEPVDHEDVPHAGVVHEQAADPQPHRPEAQPVKTPPSPRTIVAVARGWTRAAATILLAGLALAIVAALVIAGRSYYRSVSTPGTLTVDSTPRGSEILVDGTARGVTPLTLTLRPGDHVLVLRRNGLTREFPIAVTPGARLSQTLDWSTVRATGTLAISSTPSQAKVTVDGKERGVTPITMSDVPVGMRQIVIESSAGTVRRDVRVVAGSRVTINETITFGWMTAFAPIELQIYEGTRLLGTTEDGRIMVRPGRHELDFVNTRLGFRERREIDVSPGMTTAVNIATGVGIVRITAPAGADVLIDGVLFGDTPLRELRLPIGSHEIVLRHPQLGEQRVSVTVGASAPTDVSVDFTK